MRGESQAKAGGVGEETQGDRETGAQNLSTHVHWRLCRHSIPRLSVSLPTPSHS